MKKAVLRMVLLSSVMAFLFCAGPGVAQEILLIDLGTLGGLAGDESKAVAVNESGQVVGYSQDLNGLRQAFLVNPADTDGDGDPDRWFQDVDNNGTNDLMINLTIGESDACALGINSFGQATFSGEDTGYRPEEVRVIISADSIATGCLNGETYLAMLGDAEPDGEGRGGKELQTPIRRFLQEGSLGSQYIGHHFRQGSAQRHLPFPYIS